MYRTLLVLLTGAAFTACNRPMASFSCSEPGKAPSNVQFTNSSQNAQTYRWNFGDGTTSEEINPSHRFRSSGTYEVELVASDGKKERTITREVQVAPPDKCLVEIRTPYGDMLVELFDATPLHQDNFLKLAGEGYFDSLLFHRVIEGFMIQGGDPESRDAPAGKSLGRGGPGYTVEAEFRDTLIHLKGALAAARTGDEFNPERRSSGSQFYIVQGRVPSDQQLDATETDSGFSYSTEQREQYKTVGGTPFLDRQYTVFGKVIEGLDVIDRISGVRTGRGDRPLQDVWMTILIIQ